MFIVPRKKPVVENLNVYYLDIKKMLEHYQGAIGSGGVYFKSHAAEGAPLPLQRCGCGGPEAEHSFYR